VKPKLSHISYDVLLHYWKSNLIGNALPTWILSELLIVDRLVMSSVGTTVFPDLQRHGFIGEPKKPKFPKLKEFSHLIGSLLLVFQRVLYGVMGNVFHIKKSMCRLIVSFPQYLFRIQKQTGIVFILLSYINWNGNFIYEYTDPFGIFTFDKKIKMRKQIFFSCLLRLGVKLEYNTQ
jgi:hypothetical protein